MDSFDTVIRNGTVVTAADVTRCDVGIRDGRITALAADLPDAPRVIDATDRLVLPGGIDAHVHLDEPEYMGVKLADGFESGTLAAACGGNTTIMSFAAQEGGRSLRATVEDYHGLAEGRAYIDYAFHLILTEPNEQVLGQELPALVADGYTSFKVYMTYEGLRLDDRQILEILGAARRDGALVMVHAENDHCIHWLKESFLAAGRTEIGNHGRIAPMPVEREATHRAITLSEIAEVPILIVHVSGREAVEQIEWARDRGLRIYAETCPQYLVLSQDDMDRPGIEGAKYVCSPPPREPDNQEALWRALARGAFEVFSSDHCPYVFAGASGKQRHGPNAGFHQIPPGLPGIETRLPILFSEGVGKGRIDLNAFVALTATNAAKLYGLYPRKGTLAVGSDADIAIWDPAREVTLTHEILHDKADYTPYEGRRITGWPVTTLSRGEVVWDGGEVKARPGRGAFVARERSPLAAPGSTGLQA
jgi:dihydropyrimidinase